MSLPFKIEAQPAGVRKAYRRMVASYGKQEGERIFLAKAEQHGKGNTLRQKAISVYRKGAHIS